MEIDLNELELHEKQLAERRRSQQQQQEQQSTSQTDGSSGSSTLAMATSTTTTTTTTSQNVDEIDAYLDRLALDLQAKDHRTNDARGANTSNHSNHPNQHSLVNNENSSQLNDDCDKNGATAAPTNSNQASTKTTLPLLIYAFLSLLAYVNTIRCKIYTLTHTHTHNTFPFMPHNFSNDFSILFFRFRYISTYTVLCRFLIVTIHILFVSRWRNIQCPFQT